MCKSSEMQAYLPILWKTCRIASMPLGLGELIFFYLSQRESARAS
jgi:hypothetical protein